MERAKTTIGNRLTLWGIWLFALLPLAAAVLAYRLEIPVTSGSVNRGELLDPVQPLTRWGGDVALYTGHWTLLLKPEGRCGPGCEQLVTRMKSVHDALGRDADRMRVRVEVGPETLENGVWLVDPNGNLVLRYEPEQLGEPVLQDLKRLLKVSKVG